MIEFFATEIGYLEENEVINCGASNADSSKPYHYINFQRSVDTGGVDDTGVYFEIDDQINGGYNIIESCELKDDELRVKLIPEFKRMPGKTIVVKFNSLASEGLFPINQGLRKVFIGYENKFTDHHT